MNLKDYQKKRKVQTKKKIQLPSDLCEIFNINEGDEVIIKHTYGDNHIKLYFKKSH